MNFENSLTTGKQSCINASWPDLPSLQPGKPPKGDARLQRTLNKIHPWNWREAIMWNLIIFLWECLNSDESGCPFWTLSSANVGNNGYVSLTMGPWKDQRKKVVWSDVSNFLQHHVIKEAGASLTWGTFGTWMRFGKKASWGRQWDALGTVLLPVSGVFFERCPLP